MVEHIHGVESSPDKEVIVTAIGKKIKSRRQDLGLTLRDISDAIGVSIPQAHHYESGRSPVPADRRADLCAALDVSLDFFPAEEIRDQPTTDAMIDIISRAARLGVRRSDICAAAKIPPYQMTRWLKGDVAIKPVDIKAVEKAAKRLGEATKFPSAMRKRLALGISEVEIANALALDARTIREWEVRGRAPNRRKDALYVAAVDSIAGM